MVEFFQSPIFVVPFRALFLEGELFLPSQQKKIELFIRSNKHFFKIKKLKNSEMENKKCASCYAGHDFDLLLHLEAQTR